MGTTIHQVVEELSDALTPAQQQRRERVIASAVALAHHGGYDAVQMRDVSNDAGVAMGTVYRYFRSKDHLLAATLVEWVRELYEAMSQRPPHGESPAERVIAAIDRALRTMEREPQLVRAVFTSLSSPEPEAVACQKEISELMNQIVLRAAGANAPSDIAERSRMIGHVWYSALAAWISGWAEMSFVADEVTIATRFLLP